MNKVLEYIIRAKDATASGLSSALSKIKNFATGAFKNLANLQSGFHMLRQAISGFAAFMGKSFAYERMTMQFKTLIGNLDEAREHMRMLQEMGDTPPFSLEQFASASRQLMVMTDGALGYKRSLELVGDAAAATGQGIDTLAHQVGLAFATIRDGAPITRATFALRSMGAITPEVASRLEEMQKAGATTSEIWGTLEEALRKYSGAMKETEQTGEGLVGAIQSQWDDGIRDFGAALLEATKGGLQYLLDKMRELREDGSIDVWASHIVEALKQIKEASEMVGAALGAIWKYSGASDIYHHAKGGLGAAGYMATRGIVGMVNGEGFGEAWGNAVREGGEVYAKELARGHWTGKMARNGWLGSGMEWAARDNDLDDEFDRKRDNEVRESSRTRRRRQEAADKEKAAQKEAEEQERIQKQLADSQAKIDAKRAKEKEALEAEAARKAAEEEEKARIEIERAVAKEREMLLRESIKKQTKALTDAQKEEREASSRLAEAQAKERQAWGWYRDKDSWKAQLEEERAEAEAQKQFDKDFERLKFRRDWRTADLNDDEELIRRVALAREERDAAAEYARQTAEATERAAEELESIREMLEEGE